MGGIDSFTQSIWRVYMYVLCTTCARWVGERGGGGVMVEIPKPEGVFSVSQQ